MLNKSSCPRLTASPQDGGLLSSGRRRFLLDSFVLVATAALAPLAAWARPRPLRQVPLSVLNLAAFAEQLHTAFQVRLGEGGSVDLELKKAENLSPPTPLTGPFSGVSWDSFSLIFAGAQDEYLPQDTYDFEHTAMGRFSLFIVPVGRPEGDDEQRYQAVFSQLHARRAPGSPVALSKRRYE